MPNALTKAWAHGTVAQYNQKEADEEKMVVSYTSNGIEIFRLVRDTGGTTGLPIGRIKLFLPITIPVIISDAIQKLEGLKFNFSTRDTDGRIENLRLFKNNSEVFVLNGPQIIQQNDNFLENGLDFYSNSSPLSSLCLEITVLFPAGQYAHDNPPVIIGGAGITSKQKKFDYD